MADHDELVQQFSTVSGADADRAKFFLESAAWDLPTALSSFFEESGGGEGGEEGPAASGAAAASAAMDTSASALPPSRAGAGDLAAGLWPDEDSDDDDEEEEEGQAFYAGGSTHSGQQVLGPNKPKKKDMVAKLFKAAKQQGAEVMSGEAGGSAGPKKAMFKGTSYRLGETPTDTQVIPDLKRTGSRQPQTVELRMYRAGFTVDDGPFRDYQQPDNQRFLADIKRGLIPSELLVAAKGREVAINMSDMRHEQYEPPKKTLKAFSGSGQALGSPAPQVVGQVPHVPGPGGSVTKAPVNLKQQEDAAKEQLSTDSAQPTTNVQIRLSDGGRLIVRANQSHTVAHLRTYLNTARPEYTAQSIALMTAFPHAELAQPDQTLVDANLLNSTIVVKPK